MANTRTPTLQDKSRRPRRDADDFGDDEPLPRGPSGEPLDIDELEALEAEQDANASGWAKFKRIFTPVTKRDREIIGQFFGYIRPHLGRVLFAVSLSIVAGVLVLGQLILIERGLNALDPKVSPRAPHGVVAKALKAVGVEIGSPDSDQPERWDTIDRELAFSRTRTTSDERRDQLLLVVFGVIALALVAALLKYIQGVIMAGVSRTAIRRIREDAFRNMVRMPLRFHQATHSGKLMARLIKDINRLRTLLVSLALGLTTQIAVFLGALGYALMQTSWAAMFALGFVVVAIVPIRIVADKIRHRDKSAEAGSGDMFAIATEAIAGQKVVKAFTAEGHETRRFNEAAASIYEKQMTTYRLRAATEPLVDVVAGIGVAAGFWVLGAMVIEGELKLAVLATTLVALQKLAGSVRRLGKLQNDLVRGVAAAERVNVLLSADTEKSLQDETAVPFRELKDSIEYRGVRFGYDPDQPILHDISFTLNKGEMLAVVGPSGAGKTTLVDLLPRFYEVDDGAILLDGVDSRGLRLRSLRNRIGIVSQETMLFRDSIRENISYGTKNASEEDIVRAAKLANAHDFIVAKPKGYDTPLGERGGRLSGGERQRIAIARAILKDPPVLVLDEATSALDAQAEAEVQRALDNLMRGRTAIVIAHRLATVRRAHRIIVLSQGVVAEEGSHDDLMAIDGIYARAYRLQMEAMTRGDEERPMDDFFDKSA